MSNTEPLLYGDYGPRTLLRVTGTDAASFLHNLCTQDIRALQIGACSEAFVTSVQGKTLGYVRIFRRQEGFLLDSCAGQGQVLLEHFDKYHIREKVSFEDLSSGAEAFVASWNAVERYLESQSTAAPGEMQFASMPELGESIFARWEIAGPAMGYGIFSSAEAKSKWTASWNGLGGLALSNEEVSARRIAAGSPEFGADITTDNFPQEIARDAKAISFQKGCYLGQETVARIDALGHVNRLLVRLRGEGNLAIKSGDPLGVDGKQIGHITSAAWWEGKNEFWALGLVRRGQHSVGNQLLAGGNRLTVIG